MAAYLLFKKGKTIKKYKFQTKNKGSKVDE
jgi:hypothetical protein